MYQLELVAILVSLLGVLFSLLLQLLIVLRKKKRGEETTEDRIRKFTTSLKEATELISSIESEIKARSALVEKLQKDIDLYNKLVELKKPEVEAVSQLLRGELERAEKRSFWKGFAINFLFFILGALASGIIAMVVSG